MAEQVQIPDWYRSDRLIHRQNLEVRDMAFRVFDEAVQNKDRVRAIHARALWQSFAHAEAIRLNNLYHQMVWYGVDRVPEEWVKGGQDG